MRLHASFGFAIVIALSPPAFAAPPASGPEVTEFIHAAAADTAEPIVATNESGAAPLDGALNLDELGDLRGGDIVAVQGSSQNLNAINMGNTVTGHSVDSGAMNINANAFAGYEGIGNFVINTGHNNNLMGSVSVHVMVPPQ